MMFALALALGAGGRPPLSPPAGFLFVTDTDGAYLVDSDGAYILVEE